MPNMIRLMILLAAFAAASGAHAQAKKIAPQDPRPGELSEPVLYEFLLGEIALQRGDHRLAAQTFLDLARRTGDPRVARRAVEVANSARLPQLALEAARAWHRLEPGSLHALQVLAALLVGNQRVDEALPYLEKLLTACLLYTSDAADE